MLRHQLLVPRRSENPNRLAASPLSFSATMVTIRMGDRTAPLKVATCGNGRCSGGAAPPHAASESAATEIAAAARAIRLSPGAGARPRKDRAAIDRPLAMIHDRDR